MNIVTHEKVTELDFKMMKLKISDDDSQFDEILRLIYSILQSLSKGGAVPARIKYTIADCEYPPLVGWKKCRFHVGIDQEPDMRIIFRYYHQSMQVLAIGFRNYIYHVAEARDQRNFP